jgi:hypothetical protein
MILKRTRVKIRVEVSVAYRPSFKEKADSPIDKSSPPEGGRVGDDDGGEEVESRIPNRIHDLPPSDLTDGVGRSEENVTKHVEDNDLQGRSARRSRKRNERERTIR